MSTTLTYLQAAFLGIIEGLTEFLPVSSTGHLILLIDIIGFVSPEGKFFEVAIQLGAILAICVLYWRRLWNVATGLKKDHKSRLFAYNIIAAFLPAMVLGAAFHKQIKAVLFSPVVVSIALIIGGIIIIIVERIEIKQKFREVEQIPVKTALIIGFFQALAMIPGVSRSGATIIGARLLGTERKTAAEFSFFLAIPTMFAATVYDLYKNWDNVNTDSGALVAIAFISAFFTALIVVRAFIKFIATHGFTVFGWYRIVIGSVMLALLLL